MIIVVYFATIIATKMSVMLKVKKQIGGAAFPRQEDFMGVMNKKCHICGKVIAEVDSMKDGAIQCPSCRGAGSVRKGNISVACGGCKRKGYVTEYLCVTCWSSRNVKSFSGECLERKGYFIVLPRVMLTDATKCVDGRDLTVDACLRGLVDAEIPENNSSSCHKCRTGMKLRRRFANQVE